MLMRPKPRLHLFLHIAKLLEQKVRIELAASGVSHEQARYLDILAQVGPMSVSALAQRMHTSQPAVTTMMTRLLALGMVKRETDRYDARALRITLTARGRSAADAANRAWLRVEAEIARALPKAHERSLRAALLLVRDHFGGRSPSLDIGDEAVLRVARA
jgi:MarR family transcriptional regulator, organic hydroperoxide resistance regulator